jgi:NitT/TauT family transport system substrate-binding protein
MLAGVMGGIAKGIRYAMENPKAAVRGHFQQFPNSKPSGMDEAAAIEQSAKVVAINVELSRRTTLAKGWGQASQQQVELVRDALFDNEIIKKKLPWQDYFTAQFIPGMNAYDADAVVAKARAAG